MGRKLIHGYWPYTSSDVAVIDQPMRVNIPLAFIWWAYLPIVFTRP